MVCHYVCVLLKNVFFSNLSTAVYIFCMKRRCCNIGDVSTLKKRDELLFRNRKRCCVCSVLHKNKSARIEDMGDRV
jgi:hypothetical protein